MTRKELYDGIQWQVLEGMDVELSKIYTRMIAVYYNYHKHCEFMKPESEEENAKCIDRCKRILFRDILFNNKDKISDYNYNHLPEIWEESAHR